MRYILIILLIVLVGGYMMSTGLFYDPMKAYDGEPPAMDIKTYFNGPIKAWGLVQDRKGKVLQRFDVDLIGSWDGDTGTLDEYFEYYDGTTDTRTWTITKNEDGSYEGHAGDIIGKAEGRTNGFAANWAYTMALDVGDRTFNIKFDDWMYLMNDGVLINISDLKKFGFRVATLTLFMQKQTDTSAVEKDAVSTSGAEGDRVD